MRALAIIFVVTGHGTMLEKADTDFPWIKLPDGVELFFVLSGFLIGGILIKSFQQTDSFGMKTISGFWVRRWFRTLPNYYLVLTLNIVVVYLGVIKEDFSQFNLRFFLFLQNFASPFRAFFWESWSLCVEEWFYLIFPLLVALTYRILRHFKASKQLVFLCAMLILLFASILFRIFKASKLSVDAHLIEMEIYKVVIYRFDGIALGLLAAHIKHWHPSLWRKCRNGCFLLGLVLIYVILYATWPPNDFTTKVFRILLQSVGCFLLLPKFDSMRKAPAIIRGIITHLSLISYSMYLLNLALISEVIRDNFPPEGPASAWAWYAVYWVAVLAFSTLLYKYYEKPITDLRDKFQ